MMGRNGHIHTKTVLQITAAAAAGLSVYLAGAWQFMGTDGGLSLIHI